MVTRARRNNKAGLEPLSPQRKWRAITLATLLFVPAYWAIVAALVSLGGEDAKATPAAGPLIAFGLCLLPFVFIVLAFLSEHPNAASARRQGDGADDPGGHRRVRARGGRRDGPGGRGGAGGIVALRSDLDHSWKARAVAVLLATMYVFVLLRTASDVAFLLDGSRPAVHRHRRSRSPVGAQA